MSKKWDSIRIMHYYVVMIPWWDNNIREYRSKARPCVLLNNAGDDCIFLPMTSNDNADGSMKREANKFQVPVKLNRYGLIKANQPITVSKHAIIFNKDGSPKMGQQVSNNTRRKVKEIFDLFVKLPRNMVK